MVINNLTKVTDYIYDIYLSHLSKSIQFPRQYTQKRLPSSTQYQHEAYWFVADKNSHKLQHEQIQHIYTQIYTGTHLEEFVQVITETLNKAGVRQLRKY